MFWGKGDSSKLTAKEQATLTELRRLCETGHIIALTPEQTAVAISAINFYASVQSAASLFAMFRNVLIFTGSLLAIWWAGHDAVTTFIAQVLKR